MWEDFSLCDLEVLGCASDDGAAGQEENGEREEEKVLGRSREIHLGDGVSFWKIESVVSSGCE